MRGTKVLIVEDEALIAAGLEVFLEDNGFEVVGWALNGGEAIDFADRCRPDIALVDIQLKNDADGIDLAARLQREFGTTIVFLTAQTDTATRERASAVTHLAYLRKPFESEQLLSVLRNSNAVS